MRLVPDRCCGDNARPSRSAAVRRRDRPSAPRSSNRRRWLATTVWFAVASVFALPASALPASVHPAGASTAPIAEGVVPVENRFLPRIFGTDGDGGRQQAGADVELRIQQLEAQVRALTGQVEELTFTVRRLQSTLGQGAVAGQQRGDLAPAPAAPTGTAGPGAPPRSLGQLPATAAQQPQQAAAPPPGSGSPLGSGPVDLSALNGQLSATPEPSVPATGADAPQPTGDPKLAVVRDLQQSGRFAMAADAAREVLTDNPARRSPARRAFCWVKHCSPKGTSAPPPTSSLRTIRPIPTGSVRPKAS